MTGNGGGGAAFRLSIRPDLRARLAVLMIRSQRAGIGTAFLQTMRAVERRLQADPRTWGDPQYCFHFANQTHYSVLIEKLRVSYTVHNDRPVVLLEDVDPVLDHPLAQPG